MEVSRTFVLLDRDGTIIVDKHYLSDPSKIEFLEGAIDGLKLLTNYGISLILVTNQSGIGRGYFTTEELLAVHARLEEMLSAHRLTLAAIYFCPHTPFDGCTCRKPKPGMIHAAMHDFGFNATQAVFIGDSDADMAAAESAGICGIRVGNPARTGAQFFEAARIATELLSGTHN